MTVCNRSNDMIWGMFGANVVHFSMLQEYLACCIGVEVGMYHQFTNNLHVYKNTWDPEKFLQTGHGTAEYADVAAPGSMVGPLLVKNKEVFDREVQEFIDHWHDGVYTEPFLQTVAKPMCVAFKLHKLRDYRTAHVALQQCQALDWYTAGYYWLRRREEAWKLKSATSAVQG
jgi:hypothetical protein